MKQWLSMITVHFDESMAVYYFSYRYGGYVILGVHNFGRSEFDHCR